MTLEIQRLAAFLPVRARVALALGIADSVLPAIRDGDSLKTAKKALDDAWKWENGKDVTARDVYAHIEPVTVAATRSNNEREKAALCAIGSAIYYVAWHAFSSELKQKKKISVPNDMADVTEETVNEILEYASRTREVEMNQSSMVERLLTDFRTHDPNEMGKSIERQYFKD